jgi:hypothetical protein
MRTGEVAVEEDAVVSFEAVSDAGDLFSLERLHDGLEFPLELLILHHEYSLKLR